MYKNQTRRGQTQSIVVKRLSLLLANGGFTLLEILVVVLIIGILGAIALPQYQRAVLRSRFAALMPIAKSIADSNEAYYLEHGEYSQDPTKLNVARPKETPDGTTVSMFSNPEEVSFVRASNSSIPNAQYVVYQKLSKNFPDTAWCEAGDERAEEMCQALGGVIPEGVEGNSSGEDGWKAYLLSGIARPGDTFAESTGGDNGGDEPGGNNTSEESLCEASEQPADQTKGCGKNYTSGTKTRSATCTSTGWTFGDWDLGACEADPTLLAQLQSVANTQCPANGNYTCTIMDGTVSKCDTTKAAVDEDTGECAVTTNSGSPYETVYNADGTKKYEYSCMGLDDGNCYYGRFIDYTAGTSKERSCANHAAFSKDATCANGYNQSGVDYTYDSHGNQIDYNICSAVNAQGVCTAYSRMEHTDQTYGSEGRQVRSVCASVSGTTCVENNYKNVYAWKQHNSATGSTTTFVACYNSSGSWHSIQLDGKCPSDYRLKQRTYNNGNNTYKNCSSYSSINWANASC